MDRLDELRLFLAIADTGSFAKGGRRCGRSPSSTTRILGELEQRLGLRLLQRTTRNLSLTEGGARLAHEARRLLSDYDATMNYVVGEPQILCGNIKLSAPLFFGRRHFAPLVNEFLDGQPEITAHLSLEDRLVDLIEERIDVALRIGHLENSSLICKCVGHVRRLVVASPDYLRRHGVPRDPADLARHDAVLFINHANGPTWNFQGRGRTLQSFKARARLEVDRAELAIALACEGRGLTRILSYQAEPELRDGRLVRVLETYELPPLPVQLVYASNRLLAPKIRAFLDFAAPRISALALH